MQYRNRKLIASTIQLFPQSDPSVLYGIHNVLYGRDFVVTSICKYGVIHGLETLCAMIYKILYIYIYIYLRVYLKFKA
jgi:hypothetical protein